MKSQNKNIIDLNLDFVYNQKKKKVSIYEWTQLFKKKSSSQNVTFHEKPKW